MQDTVPSTSIYEEGKTNAVMARTSKLQIVCVVLPISRHACAAAACPLNLKREKK